MMDVWGNLKAALKSSAERLNALPALVAVKGRPLLPEEAIGRPGHDDYPLVKGREQMIEVEVMGAAGHAFTDGAGRFAGSVGDVLRLDPDTSFRRSILAATLSGLLRNEGSVGGTRHCRDNGPVECARGLPEALGLFLEKSGVHPASERSRIAMVGLQPRMAEALSKRFELRITDLDRDNIAKERFGCTIGGPESNPQNLEWCDAALVTGTTLTSGTIGPFLDADKPVLFYGVTIAGAARVLCLERFCPCSI